MKYYRHQNRLVRAVKFEGGADKASDIVEWVFDNSWSTASWSDAHPGWTDPKGGGGYGPSPERILIRTDGNAVVALPGTWIVMDDNETFFVYSDEDFKSLFTEVTA